jgi:hypothetical protein
MYIKAKKGLFSKETEDGLAALSKDEKKMFILNATACSIWKMCSSKMSIDDISLKLSEEYKIKDINPKDLKKDCIAIVKQNPDLFEIVRD